MQAHGGRKFWPAVQEVCTFLLGIAAILAIPGLAWVFIAESRLKRFPADLWALNSGLWLLFLVFAGTIGFPRS
jgi:hypothetical protein